MKFADAPQLPLEQAGPIPDQRRGAQANHSPIRVRWQDKGLTSVVTLVLHRPTVPWLDARLALREPWQCLL